MEEFYLDVHRVCSQTSRMNDWECCNPRVDSKDSLGKERLGWRKDSLGCIPVPVEQWCFTGVVG